MRRRRVTGWLAGWMDGHNRYLAVVTRKGERERESAYRMVQQDQYRRLDQLRFRIEPPCRDRIGSFFFLSSDRDRYGVRDPY